jgi:hypothetical protein
VKGRHPNSLANLVTGRTDINPRKRYSYAVLAKLTRRMMLGKFTVAMLAKRCEISWGSANKWISHMHKAGCVHIVEYLRSPNGRVTSRVYEWGTGDDVPKPVKKDRSEYHKQWRAKRQTLDGWRGVA